MKPSYSLLPFVVGYAAGAALDLSALADEQPQICEPITVQAGDQVSAM